MGSSVSNTMMNPGLLLLAAVFCLYFTMVDSSVGTINCSGKRGTSTTEESWDCESDGTVKCSEVVKDCSSCGDQGSESGGTQTYLANGLSMAVGGGWDCRSKCRGQRGSSGSQSR